MTEEKTLIEASMIIAYSPERNQHVLLRNGVVVFEGDTIVHVGKSYSDSTDCKIDGTGKLVAPGFINAHAELKYAALTRSYMEDLASRQFYNEALYEYWVLPTTEFLPTKAEAKTITELALLDLLRSGCTTVAEMGAAYRVGPGELIELLKTLGVRAYLGGSVSSGSWSLRPDGTQIKYEWNEDKGFESLRRDMDLIQKHNGAADGQIHVMFGMGALDLCTPDLTQEIRKQATELGVGIQAIVGETVTEFREILRRYGKTPMEHLRDLNFMKPDTILVHGLVTSEHPIACFPGGGNDLQIIAEAGASIAETAWTYLRGGRWLHTHAKYRQAGINMAVGTAGFPQDILVETRAAILASKLVEGNTYASTAMDGYNAATLGGARALGRDDLGRISKGAKADLVIFNLQTRRMAPIRDPIKNIIYSATSEDIETVIVGGKTVVSHGRVPQLDESQLADKIQGVSERFWETIPRADHAKRTVDELAPLSLPLWES